MLEIGSGFADQYRLLKLEAEGGTACLYQAFEEQSGKIVALKIFDSTRIDQEILDEIWNRESQALSRLSHPSIVRFLSAGRDSSSGLRYIVLEWLTGETLESKLTDSGPLEWQLFSETYGKYLLDALSFAFKANVVHRDLSIRNVIVLSDNSLRIIDFGQAKLDDSLIGKTVAGWKTPPYCPPEDDTGRYTNTRDVFSYCAIAIRAISGQTIRNHDDLYDVAQRVSLPDRVRGIIDSGLSRSPENRPANIIEFANLLSGTGASALPDTQFSLAIRIVPSVLDQAAEKLNIHREELIDTLIAEINDTVSISTIENSTSDSSNAFALESTGFRLLVDIDKVSQHQLAVVGIVKKRFNIDRLYGSDRWLPAATFTLAIPRTANDIEFARTNVRRFYEAFENFLADIHTPSTLHAQVFDEWQRQLQALRYIERTRQTPLRFDDAQLRGRRLTVTVANPQDAEEGQDRTITNNGRWVFNGTIEALEGRSCTLYSKWTSVRDDAIPIRGELEMDWRQAKIALDRQSDALSRFSSNKTPNSRICEFVTDTAQTDGTERFKVVSRFFDSQLSDEKKAIVSKFLATPDLLLIHGPPGTGKTTLIVEMIRQQLSENPESKILLVSQTHVAIDHVLEKLDKGDSTILPVRIGSGSKQIGQRVAHCSLPERGRQLQSQVALATEAYIQERAQQQGVDLGEIRLGLRASEVLARRRLIGDLEKDQSRLSTQVHDLSSSLAEKTEKVTHEETESRAEAKALQEDLDALDTRLRTLKAQLSVALDALRALGTQGRELAQVDVSELSDWADLLLGPDRQDLKELVELAEEWRLKFGQSDDFHIVIISMAKVVAGTCIGFCRESAAMLTHFDLCIVDEASKATTTELLVPLAQAQKAVLVGDHHQLPAVIEYALTLPELQEEYALSPHHLECQLFEALESSLPTSHKSELKTQYRMRSAIGSLISECFYAGKLVNAPDVDNRPVPNLTLAGLTKPVTWIDTDPDCAWSSTEKPAETSFVNLHEVECIVSLLRRLSFLKSNGQELPSDYSIGVIAGYAAQAHILATEIRKYSELDSLKVDCDTVHAFQGREVDVCIYSVTRNNEVGDIGFLRDWRHLNVALSRARDYLVIVGGLSFCGQGRGDNPFRQLTEYVSSNSTCEILDWIHE